MAARRKAAMTMGGIMAEEIDVIRTNDGKFNGSRGHGGPNSASGGRGSKPAPMSEKKLGTLDKSAIAKQSAKYVGAAIQRYSEEHCEPILAHGVGGHSLKDNEPVDVIIVRSGKVAHGLELKTMTTGENDKITMKASAMARKDAWMTEHSAPFHTVVFDDRKVFNANGECQHDDSKRQILYRRGFGSFRTGAMYKCKDMAELNKMIDMPDDKLPPAARAPAKKNSA